MQPKNQMIQRWICELQGYSFTVCHRTGKLSRNADALSRCPIFSNLDELESCSKSWEVAILDIVDVSDQQNSDLSIREMKDFLANKKFLEDLDQWFPTTVPRHSSVPRNDHWRAAKRSHF